MGATLGFWTPVSRPSGGCESEDKLFPLLMGLSFLICMVGTGPSESSPPGWPSGPGPRSGRNQRPGLGGGGLPRRRGGVVRWAESGPSQSGAACEEPPSAWGSVALGGGGVGVNSGQVRERGQWPELGGPWTEGRSWGALGPCFSLRTLSQWPRIYWRWLECKYSLPLDRCDPTSLPPGPPTGRWPLPLSRRRREMSSNKEQRSAVFVVLFALITILILYSSNSANEVFHYGSLRGRTRRPVNLKKWSITDAYVPILGNKGKVSFVVEHRLVHHGDCSGAV
ncbi:alpha-N-acetylgalactosaminide alpha-2,6-sialyltransferase 6 isoform X9 [Canis lupus familiaris]|nr:alpha-N-acetylgalactosaminide alpha-2,6-sialyltransferase 6 isoform X9 [Canis lupus familiaris]